MTDRQASSVDTTLYHLAELRLVEDLHDPRRCVPNYDCRGLDVLDVGCGLGQTLVAPEFRGARALHGIDIDRLAIETGIKMFPELVLSVASAEHIPYENGRFDLVFSRVALPYTNIPRAMTEIARVVRPGGRVWLSLHSWRTEMREVRVAVRSLAARRLVDRAYVCVNSLLLGAFGRCIPRPWSGTYESFQFASGLTRIFRRLQFRDIIVHRARHFYISAQKEPGATNA